MTAADRDEEEEPYDALGEGINDHYDNRKNDYEVDEVETSNRKMLDAAQFGKSRSFTANDVHEEATRGAGAIYEEDNAYGSDNFEEDAAADGSDSAISPPRQGNWQQHSFRVNVEDDEGEVRYSEDEFVDDLNRGDGKRHVNFPRELESDVFFTRPKYSRAEVEELFYTHDEARQFEIDYSRELKTAEFFNKTWYNWWHDDDDIEQREDELIYVKTLEDQEEEDERGVDEEEIEVMEDLEEEEDDWN